MRQTWSSVKVISYSTRLLAKKVDQNYVDCQKTHNILRIAHFAHIKSTFCHGKAICRSTKLIREKLSIEPVKSNPNHAQFPWKAH